MLNDLPRIVLLWTDVALWLMCAGAVAYLRHVRRTPWLRARWGRVVHAAGAMPAALVLAMVLVVTLLDSLHFRRALDPAAASAASPAHAARLTSVLDVLLGPLALEPELSYSRPLAYAALSVETDVAGGSERRAPPRLRYGGAHLQDPARDWLPDLAWRGLAGLIVAWSAVAVVWMAARWRGVRVRRASGVTGLLLATVLGPTLAWAMVYHVLGTDATGNDVLYLALKSLRTAVVIGTLASMATLPLAVGLGMAAGYWRGGVDALVRMLYTVMSAVPQVLWLAVCVLLAQGLLERHPQALETSAQRTDSKLLLLCLVLGLTGWADLCRLVRAETRKLRTLEHVRAAQALGVAPWGILQRHIGPNVVHLVLIVSVLEFSSLVLYEAVLTYVGIGVDPTLQSFGGMINLARTELSRDPPVWWVCTAAWVFMVALVLSAHLLGDAVREAFDPRTADRSS